MNAGDEHEETSLHAAASSGQNTIVKLLLIAGADVHMADIIGNTPLHRAAGPGNGNGATVQMLIAAGADIHAINHFGETPIHSAAVNDNPETIRVLVDLGADINSITHAGQSPLDIAKWHSGIWGNTDTVRAIIAAGGQSRSPIET